MQMHYKKRFKIKKMFSLTQSKVFVLSNLSYGPHFRVVRIFSLQTFSRMGEWFGFLHRSTDDTRRSLFHVSAETRGMLLTCALILTVYLTHRFTWF